MASGQRALTPRQSVPTSSRKPRPCNMVSSAVASSACHWKDAQFARAHPRRRFRSQYSLDASPGGARGKMPRAATEAWIPSGVPRHIHSTTTASGPAAAATNACRKPATPRVARARNVASRTQELLLNATSDAPEHLW
eukprot:2143370-Pyramimonas_sp.AAC.1